VFGTDSTLKSEIVTVQIGTSLLMKVSVSMWNWQYVKMWAGDSADWYSGVVEG
jgi:hypothetical protein